MLDVLKRHLSLIQSVCEDKVEAESNDLFIEDFM